MRTTVIIQIVAFFFLIPFSSDAQQNTFSKVFTDPNYENPAQAYSVVETHDSNFIIVGYLDQDALILKMDRFGEKIWDKRLAFGDLTRFYRIIPTVDSNYIIVGNGGPNDDIICTKITENGDTLWVRIIDFGNDEIAASIQETSDHGYIIGCLSYTGYYNPDTIGLVKLNSEGTLDWSVTLAPGVDNRIFSSIRQTTDSGYILTGGLRNQTVIPYEYQTFLTKFNALGDVLWAKKWIADGWLNSSGDDVIEVLFGYLCLINERSLVGIDFLGNIIWSKRLNITSTWPGYFFSSLRSKLHPLPDGTLTFMNRSWGGGNFLKIDIWGNILWTQNLLLGAEDVIPLNDLGYLIVGNGPLIGLEDSIAYTRQIGMIKTDSFGNGIDCTNETITTIDTLAGHFESFVVTSNSGGATITPISPDIISANLQSTSGCVEITPGISDISFQTPHLIISPNPSNGRIEIELDPPRNEYFVLEIYNLQGMKVYSTISNHSHLLQLDLSFLPDGIYFINAIGDKELYSQKIIIKH